MTHKSFRLSWTMARMLMVAVCVLALASPGLGGRQTRPELFPERCAPGQRILP